MWVGDETRGFRQAGREERHVSTNLGIIIAVFGDGLGKYC